MQTFHCTCPITTGLYAEIEGESSQLIGHILLITVCLSIGMLSMCIGIPRPFISYIFLLCLGAFIFLETLYIKYAPPLMKKLRACRILRTYGTPTPTLESYIEDGYFHTRVLETGRTDDFHISKATVLQTEKYIVACPAAGRWAVFIKENYSEEVLNDLFDTLEEYGADILPCDEPAKEEKA